MKKINFEYTGVLYYYFTITGHSKISNHEFKALLDFVIGYLGIDKKYAERSDVSFYFEYNLETLSKRLVTLPYLWCGDETTKHINKKSNHDDFYIGCDNINELKKNMTSLVLTNDSKAKKHLQEAVVAYLEFKKDLERKELNQEINDLKGNTGKSLVRSILNKIKK